MACNSPFFMYQGVLCCAFFIVLLCDCKPSFLMCRSIRAGFFFIRYAMTCLPLCITHRFPIKTQIIKKDFHYMARIVHQFNPNISVQIIRLNLFNTVSFPIFNVLPAINGLLLVPFSVHSSQDLLFSYSPSPSACTTSQTYQACTLPASL